MAVGIGPCALVHNPVENRVYVANSGDSTVSVLRDTGTVAVKEERRTPEARRLMPGATLVRGILRLGALGEGQRIDNPPVLLGATGRRVMELCSGANSISHLAPGVYFIRSQSSPLRKVVVQD
ncbi:MAG: hypothetical protein ABIK86_06815 [candidate division WOR-3 bacterium]